MIFQKIKENFQAYAAIRHRLAFSLQLYLTLKQFIMSKVFKVWPKRVKRTNGTVLTPEMEIVVTTKMSVSNPFYNNAQEIKETYMRVYQFDYKKACCTQSDFNYTALD